VIVKRGDEKNLTIGQQKLIHRNGEQKENYAWKYGRTMGVSENRDGASLWNREGKSKGHFAGKAAGWQQNPEPGCSTYGKLLDRKQSRKVYRYAGDNRTRGGGDRKNIDHTQPKPMRRVQKHTRSPGPIGMGIGTKLPMRVQQVK